MKTVTIHDAKTNLSKYISAAKNGETIYIGSFGNAEVLLTKVPTVKRNPKLLKSKILDSGEAFSSGTDTQVADMLLGKK
jgi:antitoxin (DNA-binding transcriptional repressor) of toxin-antitoxin stability system